MQAAGVPPDHFLWTIATLLLQTSVFSKAKRRSPGPYQGLCSVYDHTMVCRAMTQKSQWHWRFIPRVTRAGVMACKITLAIVLAQSHMQWQES